MKPIISTSRRFYSHNSQTIVKRQKFNKEKKKGENATEHEVSERIKTIEITEACLNHPNYDPAKPWRIIGEEFGNMEIENDDIGDAMFLGKKCCYFVKSISGQKKIDNDKTLSDGEYKSKTRKNTKMTFKGVPNKNLSRNVYQELYDKNSVNIEDINLFTRKLFDCEETSVWVGKMTKKIKAQMVFGEHTISP